MSPFPHVRREQVPITDPRWLASTQPDPEPEVDERRGLDGNGAMSAADLPRTAHTWGHCSPPTEREELDMDEETPVKREKCLEIDPDGDYLMPGRCKKPLGHEEPHDWGANHGAFLGEVRRAELRDTPSGVLPRRVLGEALREGELEDIEETPMPPEVAAALDQAVTDGAARRPWPPVTGRWTA